MFYPLTTDIDGGKFPCPAGLFLKTQEQLWPDALPDVPNDLLDSNPGLAGFHEATATIYYFNFQFQAFVNKIEKLNMYTY